MSKGLMREVGLVAALLVAAGGILGFLAVAEDMREGELQAFDTGILLALRNPQDLADPIGPQWLEIGMRDITSLGSIPVLALIVAVVIGYLVLARKPGVALLVAISVGGGLLLGHLLKLRFERPRPDLVAHLVDIHSLSFPSSHAMLSAVTYLTIGALLTRVERRRIVRLYILVVAVGLTLLVGLSRIYLGVHWPSDVLAGWCAGAAWAMGCWVVLALAQGRWVRGRDGMTPPPSARSAVEPR
ncbi:phosphatase PAP2 family protein [Chelatococcus asaccharovorans]|uniref:phosphatase PAP2 family protein n=1 Tax=Chelatococcus asaccharovorans TaxID=28210 RepID=UPI002263DCCA|nr:phosphatase PAP2 family protein [Chelatococcus asaccharovorans]